MATSVKACRPSASPTYEDTLIGGTPRDIRSGLQYRDMVVAQERSLTSGDEGEYESAESDHRSLGKTDCQNRTK
jgi:hypothetical protein